MNSLLQQRNGLLGDAEAVSSLAKAEQVKILAVSDTHGHYASFEAIVREFGPSCDLLLFAGDGMWDVVRYVERALVSDRLKEDLPGVAAFVAGNGDGDQYRVTLPAAGQPLDPVDAPGLTLDVPIRQIVKACGYSVLLAHGHRHSVDVSLEVLVDSASAMDCDIAVFGHTHVPFAETYAHILALNPGSTSRPRGKSEAGFAVIELSVNSTEPKYEFFAVRDGILGGYSFEKIAIR